MFSEYIEKYIKFQYDNIPKSPPHLLFLFSDNKYYMFYNEKSIINANDLPVHFKYDGVVRNKKDVYYYVGFEKDQKDNVFRKLKKYKIIVVDNTFNILDSNKTLYENKSRNIYKKIFDITKNPFITNIGIIQNTYSLYGNNVYNLSKKFYPYQNITLSKNLNKDNAAPVSLYHFDLKIDPETKSGKISTASSQLISPYSFQNNNGMKSNKSSIGISIDELENLYFSPSNLNISPNNKSISIDELEICEKTPVNELDKISVSETKKILTHSKEESSNKSSPKEYIAVINSSKIDNISRCSSSNEKLLTASKSCEPYRFAKFNKTVSDTILEEYEFI